MLQEYEGPEGIHLVVINHHRNDVRVTILTNGFHRKLPGYITAYGGEQHYDIRYRIGEVQFEVSFVGRVQRWRSHRFFNIEPGMCVKLEIEDQPMLDNSSVMACP